MNILVIQEDKSELDYLKNAFKEEKINIETSLSFVEALERVYFENFDLVILDSVVKNISGKTFCEKVRNHNNKIGLICLTKNVNFEEKIELFRIGLDDFIEKPCKFIELLYKVKALYRRVISTEILKNISLKFSEFELNTMSRKLLKDNEEINLTPTEFSLIEYLVKNKNIALSRTAIKESVWGINFVYKTNIVDVYINKIRKKINDEEGKILQSVRAHGYVLKD